MRNPDIAAREAERAERQRRYDEGLAAYHEKNPSTAHLSAREIANCGLCDDDGYRGTHVCDHQDHAASAKRGYAACMEALGKEPK